MNARMKNPATVIPEAMQAIGALHASIAKGDAPPRILELVHLRVSQINGCSVCVDGGSQQAKKAGESERRLFAVSAWRESPHFTNPERAALALAESVTRLADRADPVPDDVWQEAARHFDERALSALLLSIAVSNFYNRLNVPTRQHTAEWTSQ